MATSADPSSILRPLPMPAREALFLFHIEEIRQGKQTNIGMYTSTFEITSIIQTHKAENLRIQWARDLINKQDVVGGGTRKRNFINGPFCVKYIRREFMDSHHHNNFEKAATNLANEAQMMSALNHKNIAKLRGSSLDGTEAYYKTGRHDGYFLLVDKINETLHDRISRWRHRQKWLNVQRRLAPVGHHRQKMQTEFLFERIQCAYELADAIDYMHGHGIAHMNLNEHNVGFNSRDELQVYDLGDAVPVNSTSPYNESSEDTIILPLEKESSGGELCLKQDVLAFTSLLCELLVLRPRVNGLVPPGISHIAEGNSTIRAFKKLAKFVPSNLLQLLQRGLSEQPQSRPTMTEFLRVLGDILISLDKDNAKAARTGTRRAYRSARVTHFQLPMPLLSLKSAACLRASRISQYTTSTSPTSFSQNTRTSRAA